MIGETAGDRLFLYIRSKKQIVTPAARPHSIGYVSAQMRSRGLARRPVRLALTKRRAVDYCRVATAICPVVPLSRMR
jgi:hypothetical protein